MGMFVLTVVCILTGAAIARQYASMRRLQRARVRKNERRQR